MGDTFGKNETEIVSEKSDSKKTTETKTFYDWVDYYEVGEGFKITTEILMSTYERQTRFLTSTEFRDLIESCSISGDLEKEIPDLDKRKEFMAGYVD